MAKITNISGFPEWLPEEKLVEDQVIETIKHIFLSHGFVPLETRSVEYVSTLLSDGEVTKEIYGLQRLQNEEAEKSEASLALHFDLTVPFARYVAEHFNALNFPFRRYQLQKSWRGEKPQEGRFREFYQFDVDIIARDELPLCHDAELLQIIEKVFTKLNLADYTIRVNNRKLLLGFYASLGLSTEAQRKAIGIVDKLNKIRVDGVAKELACALNLEQSKIDQILALTKIQIKASAAAAELAKITGSDELLKQGISELLRVIELCPDRTKDKVVLDLSLARGLDYYTGTIIETHLTPYPALGSVCGGGRYEDLASRFIKQKLPGVGMSIGLTRLLSAVFKEKLIPVQKKSPTTVLVTVLSEEERPTSIAAAEKFRDSGVAAEVFHLSSKLGKQIDYADTRGIPFVAFISDGGAKVELKDLTTKEQKEIQITEWCRSFSSIANKQ